MKKVEYYAQDFLFEEYVSLLEESKALEHLPHITSLINRKVVSEEECVEESSSSPPETETTSGERSWNQFFQHHSTGQIYKPRRYILPEFAHYLYLLSDVSCIVEVGSGYGCTMFPLLDALLPTKPHLRYIATDCSPEALTILQSQKKYMEYSSHIVTAMWNITQLPLLPLHTLFPDPHAHLHPLSIDMVLCIFTLSAIPPSDHVQCLLHLKQLLHQPPSLSTIAKEEEEKKKSTKYLLFRDYGIYDFTMLEKHSIRYEEFFFSRLDGTMCYYFSLDYLRGLVESVGMRVIELSYATVINHNRKTNEKLHRVFVHGVFGVEVLLS